MEKLYIAFVDTPGLFASMIRRVVNMNYVHVVLSLDKDLFEAYSVGRRHPSVPLISGFEREELDKVYHKFPKANYRISYIECTSKQKQAIAKQLRECYKNRFDYHYCTIGLPFLLMNKEFYQKNHYTCSSFAGRILEDNGIKLFDKHFSLITPRDFYDLNLPYIYEGPLEPLAKKYIDIKSIQCDIENFASQESLSEYYE